MPKRLIAAAFALMLVFPAFSRAAVPLSLDYAVYAGGFKAMNAQLAMDLEKKSYDMKLTAETEGFIGKIFPWKATLNTNGHMKGASPVPYVYTERSTWKSGVKVTEVRYSPQGKVLKTTIRSEGKTVTARDIDDMLARNTVDLLTGALVMLQTVKTKGKCAGQFPIFDGRRRYNITLADDGREKVKASKYSAFEGDALRCILRVEPVAGFKKKDERRGWMAVQNHTEARHKPPTIWLSPLGKGRMMAPVRMEIASEYGSVVAHLVGGFGKL